MSAFKANKVNHKEKLSKIKMKKTISITRLVQNNLKNGDWVNFQYFKKLLKLRYTLYNLWKKCLPHRIHQLIAKIQILNSPTFFPKVLAKVVFITTSKIRKVHKEPKVALGVGVPLIPLFCAKSYFNQIKTNFVKKNSGKYRIHSLRIDC